VSIFFEKFAFIYMLALIAATVLKQLPAIDHLHLLIIASISEFSAACFFDFLPVSISEFSVVSLTSYH